MNIATEFTHPNNTNFHRRTVLIVDRNAHVAMELCATVESHNGHSVGPLESVVDALVTLGSATIDAAVIDGDMPGSGLLRAHLNRYRIPCIVQSERLLKLELNILDDQSVVLLKPVSTRAILFVLARVLLSARPCIECAVSNET